MTFGAAKVGLAVAPGRFHSGPVHVAPIGLEPAGNEHALLDASVLAAVPRKSAESTKYRAGSVLVVGGSRGLSGAPMLAALAAFRADAGYVTVAAPGVRRCPCSRRAPRGGQARAPRGQPRAACCRAPPATCSRLAERAHAVVLGPGLGRSDGTRDLVRVLLEQLAVPVVLDADGLWELEPFERAAPTVMTPHAGELARLLGTEADEIDAHRLESVRRAASRFGATVLLKGTDTLSPRPARACSSRLTGHRRSRRRERATCCPA